LFLAFLLCTSAALAEPSPGEKETARALMDEGDRKLSKQDLRGALQAYQGADQIMGVPTTGLEVATGPGQPRAAGRGPGYPAAGESLSKKG
jgi:hypothetical protein